MNPIIFTAVVSVLIAVPLAIWLMRPKCPGCGRRTLRTVTPEERGAAVFQGCSSCDWIDAEEQGRRAKKISEEQERRAKIDEEARRHKEQAPARSILWLLRYVAMADQELHPAERQFFIKHVKMHFPEEKEENLERWIQDLPPDPRQLSFMLEPFREQKVHLRQSILRTIEEMANADGKVLPIERERVEEVRRGLGL